MEPAERIRAIYAAFNADDVEGAAALFHPDVVAVDAPELPGGETYHGRAALAGALRTLREMFDGPVVTVEDVRWRGDRAVALIRARGRGAGGGVPIDTPIAHVFTFRDGEIVAMDIFLDHAAGLAHAGL